ncbi:MAG: hypothetical protein HYV40_04890 [Candidatus Levybacteria bacterium]|nr:hypothetical protein [Candidatus Levybacteria bacterium]
MKDAGNREVPEFLRIYFWDVEFENVSIEKNPHFVLKRILDRGDTRALRWAMTKFTLSDIRAVITSSRDVSRKTANFWAFFMDIDPKEVLCLQKPYSRIPFGPFS